MRKIPLLSLLFRSFLIVVIFLLIVSIIRQWNEGLSFLMDPQSSCASENMQFIAYNQKIETSRGKRFPCALKRYLDQWKISDEFEYKFEGINVSNVAFVMYSSYNHFYEARRAIRSIRSVFKNRIIFYDLGLQAEEIAELADVCNLEVRNFAFTRYPPFISNLTGYNFKPLIMAEVFSELESYWIVDTSVRFFNITPFLSEFYANITSGAIETMILRHPSSHSIFAATHPQMYEYLPIDLPLAKELEMLEANTMFIARSEMSREAVKWNALCALTADCMAPAGSKQGCWFELDRYNTTANCHRYDQSSLNIIMSSLLERDGWKRRDRLHDDSMSNFTLVERDEGDVKPLRIPC